MIRLRLYTTLGCHLCEQLEALLATLMAVDYRLDRIEISEDDELIERYGVRIPVLVDDRGVELERGFMPEHLAEWLAARGWRDEAAWQRLRDGDAAQQEPGGAKLRGGRRYLSPRA